jgi:two-component system chemotaxis response regulator CheY
MLCWQKGRQRKPFILGECTVAKIMVVDDAAFMRNMMKHILAELGHVVVGEASTGEEAVHTYKMLKPDIVTMDITMPDKDGIQALKEIRQYDSKAKVIMVSAMGQKDMVLTAVQSGAVDFIVKPFQREKIEHAISKHV